MKTALVVPSNRPENLTAFLNAWAPWPWDLTILVHDGPDMPAMRSVEAPGVDKIVRYCWQDIDAEFGARAVLFSRRDSGIRSYGFHKAAVTHNADVILTLDDDCYPLDDRECEWFVKQHLEPLKGVKAWQTSILGVPTRGYPYENHGCFSDAVCNMGLWSEVGDYDAPQTLAMMRSGDDHTSGFCPKIGGSLEPRLMNPYQYFPFCGMNIAFRSSITPLMLFPKMGDGVPYRRFDDIWCGIILQKICAHLRLGLTVGGPVIKHIRASNAFVNLEKEAPGIVANEVFWELIHGIKFWDVDNSPLRCMTRVGTAMQTMNTKNEVLTSYLNRLGLYTLSWCSLFDADERWDY